MPLSGAPPHGCRFAIIPGHPFRRAGRQLLRVQLHLGPDEILVSNGQTSQPVPSSGFKAVVTPSTLQEEYLRDGLSPVLHSIRHFDHFRQGDVIVLQPKNGFVRTIFRPDSQQNALFITDRCNSNCLMCSQPPKDHDDSNDSLHINLQLIPYLPIDLGYLGITGGEPTLLGDGLLRILEA